MYDYSITTVIEQRYYNIIQLRALLFQDLISPKNYGNSNLNSHFHSTAYISALSQQRALHFASSSRLSRFTNKLGILVKTFFLPILSYMHLFNEMEVIRGGELHERETRKTRGDIML